MTWKKVSPVTRLRLATPLRLIRQTRRHQQIRQIQETRLRLNQAIQLHPTPAIQARHRLTPQTLAIQAQTPPRLRIAAAAAKSAVTTAAATPAAHALRHTPAILRPTFASASRVAQANSAQMTTAAAEPAVANPMKLATQIPELAYAFPAVTAKSAVTTAAAELAVIVVRKESASILLTSANTAPK